MISIVIAEDDFLLGQLVSELLAQSEDIAIAGRATTGQEALELVDRLKPDVLLLDVHLPVLDGWQVLQRLGARGETCRTVLMSLDYTPEGVRQARLLGAAEFLDKRCAVAEIQMVIRRAASGETWFRQQRWKPHAPDGSVTAEPGAEALTAREQSVARLICQGSSNAQIAAALGISKSTVGAHISHIMFKLNVQNRTHLARVVVERGLLGRDR